MRSSSSAAIRRPASKGSERKTPTTTCSAAPCMSSSGPADHRGRGRVCTSPGCRTSRPWVFRPPQGVLVTLAALTMGPAVLWVASRFGLLEPQTCCQCRGWRRVGTAIVLARSHPGGLVRDRAHRVAGPARVQGQLRRSAVPAEDGAVGGRIHRSRTAFLRGPAESGTADARTDHDMRNPADMLILEARRQGRAAHARGRPGAVHHPAARDADQPRSHSR